jgi:hypothetical protein
MEKVKVVFRKWKGEIIALFPEIKSNNYLVLSYMHVGQHSDADYHGIIRESKPAKEDEYKDLFNELTSIGYDLKVVKKAKLKW